jgi:Lrp/AsnC family transcriptional regulator of ectoine degradation
MSQVNLPCIDRLDKKILNVLHRNGRITKSDLSQEVGLSSTRCSARMDRLEKSLLIRGYHADIDLRLLARLSFFHVQVRLFETTPVRMRQFEQLVARTDVIISCQAVLGTVDYQLIVIAPSTEAFQAIMDDIAQREVRFEFVTFPVSKHIKHPHNVALSSLIDMS